MRQGGGSRLALTFFIRIVWMAVRGSQRAYFARTFSSGNWTEKLQKFGVKFADYLAICQLTSVIFLRTILWTLKNGQLAVVPAWGNVTINSNSQPNSWEELTGTLMERSDRHHISGCCRDSDYSKRSFYVFTSAPQLIPSSDRKRACLWGHHKYRTTLLQTFEIKQRSE